LKLCGKCKIIKSDSAFYKASRYKDGLSSPCKECRKNYHLEHRDKALEKMRKYSAENSEAAKARSKKWRIENRDKRARQANKRRARIRNVQHVPYTEEQVLKLYGINCHICNKEVDLKANRKTGAPGWELGLHIDHVIDLSKGGPDKIENVRPAHGVCNLKKPKYK
jgi:5-methylcytosine-specific restriction endonuclease McrA